MCRGRERGEEGREERRREGVRKEEMGEAKCKPIKCGKSFEGISQVRKWSYAYVFTRNHFIPPPQGDSILESSTEMVHSGELHKISKGHSQERHFFLFDHQLIYCKKVRAVSTCMYHLQMCMLFFGWRIFYCSSLY